MYESREIGTPYCHGNDYRSRRRDVQRSELALVPRDSIPTRRLSAHPALALERLSLPAGREGTDDDDRVDVAWITSPSDHAAWLAKRLRFLGRSELSTDVTLDERTIVSVHGFPGVLVKSAPDTEAAAANHQAAQVQLRVPTDIVGFNPPIQFRGQGIAYGLSPQGPIIRLMSTATLATAAAVRDHVFLSYASEDAVVADWLARKLASLGYAVWYDRMKLLGGEPWPQVIDAAIKTRTHRMVQLISPASLSKPNPTGERTLAQSLTRALCIPDFFIPVNIASFGPTDLPFTLTAVQYISFEKSWAAGLASLVETLEAANTPRTLGEGRELALRTFDASNFVLPQPEKVISNLFPVTAMPESVLRFRSGTRLPRPGMCNFRERWVARIVNDSTCLAFWPPPPDVTAEFGLTAAGGAAWRNLSSIDGIDSRSVIVALTYGAMNRHMRRKGLKPAGWREGQHFPDGLLAGNRLPYYRPDGKRVWIHVVGERTRFARGAKEKYRYHLSPRFKVERGTSTPFLVSLRNYVYLTDSTGKPLEGRHVNSRRKNLCKDWWNPEWLARCLAVGQFLADTPGEMTLGGTGASKLALSSAPLALTAPVSVNESAAEQSDSDFQSRDFEPLDSDEPVEASA